MALSPEARNKRRAMIVRRWAAYRVGQAQREIWRRKREALSEGVDEVGDADGLLAELPDALID